MHDLFSLLDKLPGLHRACTHYFFVGHLHPVVGTFAVLLETAQYGCLNLVPKVMMKPHVHSAMGFGLFSTKSK